MKIYLRERRFWWRSIKEREYKLEKLDDFSKSQHFLGS